MLSKNTKLSLSVQLVLLEDEKLWVFQITLCCISSCSLPYFVLAVVLFYVMLFIVTVLIHGKHIGHISCDDFILPCRFRDPLESKVLINFKFLHGDDHKS